MTKMKSNVSKGGGGKDQGKANQIKYNNQSSHNGLKSSLYLKVILESLYVTIIKSLT